MALPKGRSRTGHASQRAQHFAANRHHFVDYELLHARQIAFVGTIFYTTIVFLVINAAFGWSLWPWLSVIAPTAVIVGLILAMLPSRD